MRRSFETGFALGLTLACAGLVATMLAVMDRGFDFTDEAFYLLSAADPARYSIAYGLFGYGLHPAYLLAEGSPAGLRRLATLILCLLGVVAVAPYVADPDPSQPQAGGWRAKLPMLAVGAVLPLASEVIWLPTPSYNGFALAGGLLLVAAIGLLRRRHGRRAAAFAAAASGILGLLARPSHAAAFGFIYLVAVAALTEDRWTALSQAARAAALAALGLALLALALPLTVLADQVRAYLEVFGPGRPAGRSVLIDTASLARRPEGIGLAATVAAFLWAAMRRSPRPPRPTARLVAIAAITLAVAALATRPLVFVLGTAASAVCYGVLAFLAERSEADRALARALGLAGAAIWAAAIGTSNDLGFQATLFWGLALIPAVIALARLVPASLAPAQLARAAPAWRAAVTATAVLIVAGAVARGAAEPYRLAAPLWRQTEPTAIGAGAAMLKLDPDTSRFVRQLRVAAAAAGFSPGDPVMNFAGNAPGVTFILGGRAPGFPWIFGGYPMTERLARAAAAAEADLPQRAWLVLATSEFALPTALVAELGFDPARRCLVAEAASPGQGFLVRLYAPPAASRPCPERR